MYYVGCCVVNKLYKIKRVLKLTTLESNRESSFDPRMMRGECQSVISNGLPMMFTPPCSNQTYKYCGDRHFIEGIFKGTLMNISIIRTLFLVWFRFMVFNATFNNSLAISQRSVLLLEETGVPGENHPPAANHNFYHMLYRVHLS